MSVSVDRILLGIDNCYLLRGDSKSAVLIDAGMPNQGKAFVKAVQKLGVDVRDIDLMLITHGHWDHIGSAKSIHEATDARIAMHGRERYRLEKGVAVMPRGTSTWGHVFGAMLGAALPMVRIPRVGVDLYVGDDGFSLEEWGIAGQVVHTPGHSPGSLSVVLESGEAFVGDQAMDGFPLRRTPGLPIFAEEPELVAKSWRRLFDEQDLVTIYPAHGDAFSAEVMRKAVRA